MAANNSGIGADACSFFYEGFSILMLSHDGAAGVNYIGEYSRRPQKHIIFTNYTFINAYIILYFNIITQYYVRRYHHILAQVAVLANFASAHDMRKMPNFCAFSNFTIFINK